MVDVAARLRARAEIAGVALSDELSSGLLRYLEVLTLWNRRMNLTAFDLSVPGDEAIDRLLVEPVAAAALVPAGACRALDIGSGGGSPALPLALASGFTEQLLVEARAKKAAFLREAVRTLGVPGRVEAVRVEDLSAAEDGGFDLISLRAVRADAGLWLAIDRLLAPGGRVLWFGGVGHTAKTVMVQCGSIGVTIALERRVS